MKNFLFLFVLILVSSFLYAQYYGGFVVADTPGAYGSYWHTSLTLTNPSEQEATVSTTLYLSNGENYKFELKVPAGSSVSKLLIDILRENQIEIRSFFGWVEMDFSNLPQGMTGETLMYTPDPNAGEGAIFAERTEIFFPNETEMALYPLTPCGKDAKEPMALGGAVWRTNVGLVNPSSNPTKVQVECYDGDFTYLLNIEIDLNPKEIKQLNDVRRPEIWNLTCGMIKEPVICFFTSLDENVPLYVYGANVNNVNNFPLYIPPR